MVRYLVSGCTILFIAAHLAHMLMAASDLYRSRLALRRMRGGDDARLWGTGLGAPLERTKPSSIRKKGDDLDCQTAFHTGTTIVGVCCRDGVILGADTKSTAGTGIADSGTAKLRRIFPRRISAASEARLNCASTRKFELDQSRVYIGCGGAGVSADCEQACARLSAIIEALLFDASLNSSPNRSRLPLNLMTIASRTMTEIIHAPREGQVSCSMLLGGCGESQAIPASLYRISSIEGEAAVQLPFGSVGSGAADALAALETAGLGKLVESQPSSIGTFSTFCNISVAEAVSIVRSAVRAGISNDLGSGFHVDLLAMTPFGWRMWREECCRKEESRIKGQSRINGLQRMHRKELSSRVGPEHGWYVAWNATAEGLSSSRHGAIDELQRAKIRQVVPVIDAQCE